MVHRPLYSIATATNGDEVGLLPGFLNLTPCRVEGRVGTFP